MAEEKKKPVTRIEAGERYAREREGRSVVGLCVATDENSQGRKRGLIDWCDVGHRRYLEGSKHAELLERVPSVLELQVLALEDVVQGLMVEVESLKDEVKALKSATKKTARRSRSSSKKKEE